VYHEGFFQLLALESPPGWACVIPSPIRLAQLWFGGAILAQLGDRAWASPHTTGKPTAASAELSRMSAGTTSAREKLSEIQRNQRRPASEPDSAGDGPMCGFTNADEKQPLRRSLGGRRTVMAPRQRRTWAVPGPLQAVGRVGASKEGSSFDRFARQS